MATTQYSICTNWVLDDSNNSNHPIIRTPPFFPGKKLNFCIPGIRTPTFEIIIPISEHLYTPRGAQTGVAECLLAFDSLCGARARVTEHLLAYYRRFRTSTRLLLSLQSSNERCQTCTSLRRSLQSSNEHCQTCTSL